MVSYKPLSDFPGWISSGSEAYVTGLIERYGSRQVLEVGGGANPLLRRDYVRRHGIAYTLNDVEPGELAKAEGEFEQVVLDLATSDVAGEMSERFDFVFSMMVGEHISDGRQFHQNVYKLLRPGGISFHCFSTLWAAPFVVNFLLPEWLSSRLHHAVDPRDDYRNAKFPARYSWCRGPSKTMVRNFQELGFEVIEYAGYFGHNYYYKLPWLHRAEAFKAKLLLSSPSPHLCSYASVLLRKPHVGTREGDGTNMPSGALPTG